MKNILDKVDEIYLAIKANYPDFEKRDYDGSGNQYYGQTSLIREKNGNGFKLFKTNNLFYLGVKENLKTGKLNDFTFLLPDEFEKAKIKIFDLYDLNILNKSSQEDDEIELALIEKLDNFLEKSKYKLKKKVTEKTGLVRYLSEYDDKFAPIHLSIDYRQEIKVKIKKYFPFQIDFNRETNGSHEFKLYEESLIGFSNIENEINQLFATIKHYFLIKESIELSHILKLLNKYSLKLQNIYSYENKIFLIINKDLRFIINFRNPNLVFNFEQKTLISIKEFGFTIQGIDEAFNIIFKEQKQSEFLRIKGDRILNLKVDSDIDLELETSDPANVEWYSENDEVASVEDGNVVGEGVGETNIVAKLGDLLDSIKIITHPTLVSPIVEPIINKVVLSDKARDFVNTYMNILDEVEENLDLLIDLYDELEESDYTFPEVIDAISIISEYYKSEKNNINKVRYIYASKSFLKKIKEVEIEYQKNLEEIQERLYKLEKEELQKYLLSKRLVYIDDLLKIRVKTGKKHRIIFCFGDKIQKESNDIYLIDYNTDHDFSNLKNIHPENLQYEIWAIEKTKISVPPLTQSQTAIALSFNKPLICKGCAGSGKTLISVYMYLNILDNEYLSDSSVTSDQLVYITYNQNAKNNALNQLKLIIEKANTKTISEFFRDIVYDEVQNMSYVDEDDFFTWWHEVISDYQLKNKMNKISSSNSPRYVYTFFRGFFKGSMLQWTLSSSQKHLNEIQFYELMRSEPISEENIKLIYLICSTYQHFLEHNNAYDDNDLARMAIKKLHLSSTKKYHHIILDETQDLTEIQLEAIIKASTNKRNLYFFGDQNQSINPTLLSLDNIKMALTSNDITLDNEDIYELNSSFRYGQLLANYINELIKLKQIWIGKTAIDETESSNISPEKNRWAGTTQDPLVIDELILRASNTPNAIIIVPDNEIKKKIEFKYGPEVGKRVTSIYDSKGLEWDYIILYNMLSFHEDKYLEMIQRKAKHSTLHRMIFNQYYVGCTRALTCFSVLEDNLNEDIHESILGNLQHIDLNTIDLYIKDENDVISWYGEALRLFESGNYYLSLSAFEKAEMTPDVEIKMDVCKIMLDNQRNSNMVEAAYLKSLEFYREAGLIYRNAKAYRLEKLMDSYLGVTISHQEIWDIILQEQLTEVDIQKLNEYKFIETTQNDIKIRLEKLKSGLKGK